MSGSTLKVTFIDGESSLCIPADQIREFTMQLKGDDK